MKESPLSLKTHGLRGAISGTLLCLVILTAIILSIYQFNVALRDIIQTRTYTLLQETARFHQATFKERVNAQFSQLDRIAAFLADTTDTDYKHILPLLKSAVSDSGFLTVSFSNRNGQTYSDNGRIEGIADPFFYARVMSGEDVLSEPLTMADHADYVMGVPVLRDGNPIGIVYGSFNISSFASSLVNHAFGGQSSSFITAKNGYVITNTNNSILSFSEENVLDFLGRTSLIDNRTAEEVKENLLHSRRDTVSFINNGRRLYATYTPLGVNDWYIFTVASGVIAAREADVIHTKVIKLTIQLFIVMGIIFLYILWRISHSSHMVHTAMSAVKHSRSEYQALVENIRGGVCVCNGGGTMEVLYASSGFTALTGFSLEDMEKVGSFIKIIHPSDAVTAAAAFAKSDGGGNLEFRILRKNHTTIWVLDNWQAVRDERGKSDLHCVLTDITALREEQEALRLNEERYRLVFQQTESVLLEYDFKTRSYITNSGYEKLLGRPFTGHSIHQELISEGLLHKDDIPAFNGLIDRVSSGVPQTEADLRVINATSAFKWYRVTMSTLCDQSGRPIRAIGRVTDVDNQRRENDRLREEATRDPLTGSYNKVSFSKRIEHHFQENPTLVCAFVMLDIDDFKNVNDTLGHMMGDAVLVSLSQKIKSLLGEKDIFGRMGGDEFAILLIQQRAGETIRDRINVIFKAVEYITLKDAPGHTTTISMGAAIFPTHGSTFGELYLKSDLALYQGKKNGKRGLVVCEAVGEIEEVEPSSHPE